MTHENLQPIPEVTQSNEVERKRLIPLQRSIIPSCDVESLADLKRIVGETSGVQGVGGFKVGLGLDGEGLIHVVEAVRQFTDKAIIYDHQKAGNDIPDMGKTFASMAKKSGVDAVILFPFTGPVTQEMWTAACQDAGLVVIVGGQMTHEKLLESEGGYISDSAPEKIYRTAAKMGVRDFVVPGNKVNLVNKYKEIIEDELGNSNFTLYAPGFVAQGGNISEAGKAAGDNWHAIVGSGIYKADNMREAAEELASQL